MKPEAIRLLSLDILVTIACLMQFFKGISPQMFAPVLIAQLSILGYSLYLLWRLKFTGRLNS